MFALQKEPFDYIISVHIRNILETENLEYSDIIRHLQNLINTYGSVYVEFTIKDLFPQFYQTYFNEVA